MTAVGGQPRALVPLWRNVSRGRVVDRIAPVPFVKPQAPNVTASKIPSVGRKPTAGYARETKHVTTIVACVTPRGATLTSRATHRRVPAPVTIASVPPVKRAPMRACVRVTAPNVPTARRVTGKVYVRVRKPTRKRATAERAVQ
jgi:hypothetical protein